MHNANEIIIMIVIFRKCGLFWLEPNCKIKQFAPSSYRRRVAAICSVDAADRGCVEPNTQG